MKNTIFSLFSFLSIVSCVTFNSSDNINKNLFNPDNINGTYKNTPNEYQGLYVSKLSDVFDRNTRIFNVVKPDKKYDLKNISVNINLISEKELKLKIIENETQKIITEKAVKIKLKKDGYIYIKDKNFMIDGIPVILGGWNIQKSRMYIDEENNLNIESNYFFYHAALIVMCDWKNFNYHLKFKKQNKNSE